MHFIIINIIGFYSQGLTRTILYNATGSDCTTTKVGFRYAGSFTGIDQGLPCQPWADSTPNKNDYLDSVDFPEGSAKAAGNKCRNPTANNVYPRQQLWCYTTSYDPDMSWGNCSVPLCGMP